MKDCEQLQPT